MGVCTFLVSDKNKSWFDLGKVFFEETAVKCLKEQQMAPSRPSLDPDQPAFTLEGEIAAWLQDGEFNDVALDEAEKAAATIAAWMRAHPDWRFLSEADEAFYDVYLAEGGEDVKHVEDPACAIYTKDGEIEPPSGEVTGREPAIEIHPETVAILDGLRGNLTPAQLRHAIRAQHVRLDAVYLPFEAVIAPGAVVEIRPSAARRVRFLGEGKYAPVEDVPISSIEPFRVEAIGPYPSTCGAWTIGSGIYFTEVHLDGTGRSDLIGESLAFLVMQSRGPFSTSPSAADVYLKVANRGTETVTFAGQITGTTPSEKAAK